MDWRGPDSEEAKELSHLYDAQLDALKSGVQVMLLKNSSDFDGFPSLLYSVHFKVVVPKCLRSPLWPHFMKEGDLVVGKTRKSVTVAGKIYDIVMGSPAACYGMVGQTPRNNSLLC